LTDVLRPHRGQHGFAGTPSNRVRIAAALLNGLPGPCCGPRLRPSFSPSEPSCKLAWTGSAKSGKRSIGWRRSLDLTAPPSMNGSRPSELKSEAMQAEVQRATRPTPS
jgi:hypothetical protein